MLQCLRLPLSASLPLFVSPTQQEQAPAAGVTTNLCIYGSQSLTSLGLDSLWAPFHSASTAREIGSAVTLENLTLGQLP